MAATGLQVNWTAASFTPSGGSLSACGSLISCNVSNGGSLIEFSGSNDRGPRVIVNDYNQPTIQLTTGDEAWVLGLSSGTVGAFTITHKDAKLGSNGDIVLVLSPCVVDVGGAQGEHRQFGRGTIAFRGQFSDGQTHPLSFTRA